MGYILLQPDNSEESINATKKLRGIEECDFDSYMSGARLRPFLFNSRVCRNTESHYHEFVGEIACNRWAQAIEKRYLWGPGGGGTTICCMI